MNGDVRYLINFNLISINVFYSYQIILLPYIGVGVVEGRTQHTTTHYKKDLLDLGPTTTHTRSMGCLFGWLVGWYRRRLVCLAFGDASTTVLPVRAKD